MSSLQTKLIHAFKEQEHCDVEVQLKDGSLIKAHRVVLLLGAKWFEGRLRGDWDVQPNIITCKCNVHSAENTRKMIEFLYSGDIILTVQNIEELYQISDYYQSSDLIKRCLEFLEEIISEEHIFDVLTISYSNGIEDLKLKCFNFIDHSIENILLRTQGEDQFNELPLELVLELISRDTLCVHEELLFKNLNLWVSRVDDVDASNVWKRIMQHVRLGRMNLDFFLEHVVKKQIIDDQDSVKVMAYLSTVDEQLCNHYARYRNVVRDSDIVVNRFLECSDHSTWIVDNTLNGDRICFTVNFDMKLRGFLVYGTQGHLIITIMLYNSLDELVGKTNIKESGHINSTDVAVIFPTPLSIDKNISYTAVVKISGGPTYYGIRGLKNVNFELKNRGTLKVVFQDATPSGETTVYKGQIKGIVFQ